MSPARLLPIVLLAIGSASNSASAQVENLETRYQLERFRLATDHNGVLDAESADVIGHFGIDLGLWLGYADDPLNVYRDSPIERERVGSLVSHRLGGDLVVAASFYDRFQIGIDLPLIISQDQQLASLTGMPTISSFGLGNIRLAPKVQLVHAESVGFDLAVIFGFTLPTSGEEDYFGDSGPTFSPELAVSAPLTSKLRVAANVGYLVREQREVLDLSIDDEIYFHVGAGHMVHEMVELDATVSAATAAADFLGAFNRNFSELRGGVGVHFTDLTVFAGVGAGTSEGFGTPDWRFLGGLRFAARRGTRPGKGATTRGSIRVADVGDGSALHSDTDSDGDGILDPNDACPLAAELVNGIRDDDGCPETRGDADEDGVNDENDRCPKEEDVDGFEDLDGCLDADNDGDGVLDGDDRCPGQAGSKALAGCLAADSDRDGVPDSTDNCPDAAGSRENFGCDDEQLVRLTGTSLDVLEKVYFLSDKSTIRPRSYRLLRNVAAVIIAHPELSVVNVEGHTDDRGSESYNISLSKRRADAVRNFLIAAGVAGDRLGAVGRGESNPISDNATSEGQSSNRRVEFVLVGPVNGTIEQR